MNSYPYRRAHAQSKKATFIIARVLPVSILFLVWWSWQSYVIIIILLFGELFLPGTKIVRSPVWPNWGWRVRWWHKNETFLVLLLIPFPDGIRHAQWIVSELGNFLITPSTIFERFNWHWCPNVESTLLSRRPLVLPVCKLNRCPIDPCLRNNPRFWHNHTLIGCSTARLNI